LAFDDFARATKLSGVRLETERLILQPRVAEDSPTVARLAGWREAAGTNRIYTHHMVRNPASGRVLAEAGMRRERLRWQRVRKRGRFEDVVVMAILRQDWKGLNAATF
jgi:hypothetical protein